MRALKASASIFPLIAMMLFSLTAVWAAPAENTLYTFTSGVDGSWPHEGVIFGPDGALYGATQYGGAHQLGTIYKVVPNSHGTWTQSVIYSFTDVNDGAGPICSLAFDAKGNIYGTTAFGGSSNNGTVFELSPNSDGTWSATMLYAFTGGADGDQPLSGVIIDKGGNLYGATPLGGLGGGVIYELSPNTNGAWTQNVLHTFTGSSSDGWIPSSLLLDPTGNLYGTTTSGAIFELSPSAGGSWTETILYSLNGKGDGGGPSSLIMDKSGNLYGTATGGGIMKNCDTGCGAVFRLGHSASGAWTFNKLYSFSGPDGANPDSLLMDSLGNLYGATSGGGSLAYWGVAFELKRNSTGQRWTYTLLYDFTTGTAGIGPALGSIKAGKLYGTAESTPSCYLCGTVFEVTP